MRATITVTFRNGAPTQEVSLGAFAQIAAKRRYGLEALNSGDPEVILFGAFVELEGPQKAKDPDLFDEWLLDVDNAEVNQKETDPADPPPAEIPSSDTSDESPPTSA